MFKNEYFEVKKLEDDAVLITDRQGVPYKWGEKAVLAYCPAYNQEISPFLVVKYSDNTWSLCHAEAGPMPEATKVLETTSGECPIVFQEDFLDDIQEYPVPTGCVKKMFVGLLSLGAMLIGTDAVLQKCTPVNTEKTTDDQKDKSCEVVSQKSPYAQDTCMIIKSEMQKLVQNIIDKSKIKR